MKRNYLFTLYISLVEVHALIVAVSEASAQTPN